MVNHCNYTICFYKITTACSSYQSENETIIIKTNRGTILVYKTTPISNYAVTVVMLMQMHLTSRVTFVLYSGAPTELLIQVALLRNSVFLSSIVCVPLPRYAAFIYYIQTLLTNVVDMS